jgi:hypothetical protein
MLWKYAWMNQLAGHLVVKHIAKRPVDPYEGIAAGPADVDIHHVATTLGIASTTVRNGLANPGALRGGSSIFRHCPRCMSRGYHGVVHQLGRQSKCPVHGCPLATECRGCGTVSDYRIDARTLGAPFKCPQCRRPYAKPKFVHRKPLPQHARTAITRTVVG